jgi:16S rRNA (uracil1498-N3)-methyltransferase
MIDMLRRSAAHVFISSLASPVLEMEDAHHLLKVLRISERDVVTVSDGRGNWITAKLDKHGELHPLSEIFETAPRKHVLSVAFAPVKGEKPEVIVQKLTELGIDEIIPLAPTRNSVIKWDDARAAKNEERLRKIAREAAMQSRRTWLPSIRSITALAEVLAMPGCAIAEPGGCEITRDHHIVIVGPEGGFSSEELTTAAPTVSLGESILRAETAAIVAGALMMRASREAQ